MTIFANISEHEDVLLRFNYDSYLVLTVRQFSVREWNRFDKNWVINLQSYIVEKRKVFGNTVIIESDALKSKIAELINENKKLSLTKEQNKLEDFKCDKIKSKLYTHQIVAIDFIKRAKKAIIADEMGLGKTLIAIAYVANNSMKALVITPASLKYNFQQQVQQHSTMKSIVLNSDITDEQLKEENDFVIINYESVVKNVKLLVKYMYKFDCVIIDEAHYIKSQSSQRTRVTKMLARMKDNVIMLTGTPIFNRPIDGFELFSLCDMRLFRSYYSYAVTYCGAVQGKYGLEFGNATNVKELAEKVKHFFIRRRKQDLLDLPEKQRVVNYINFNSKKEYNKASYDFLTYVNENFGTEQALQAMQAVTLTKLSYLRQICANEKVDNTIERIENIINDKSCVVFSCYVDVVNRINEELIKKGVKVFLMTSSDNAEQRAKIVDDFNLYDGNAVFLSTIQLGGTGLNLVKAQVVIFNDFSLSASQHLQAEDRIYRIGQSKNVQIFYDILKDSIEQDLYDLIAEKERDSSLIVDNKDFDKIEGNLLSSIIKRLKSINPSPF